MILPWLFSLFSFENFLGIGGVCLYYMRYMLSFGAKNRLGQFFLSFIEGYRVQDGVVVLNFGE